MNKLNVDKTLSADTKRNIVIGGRTYSIDFNDDTEKVLSGLTVTLGALLDQLNKETPIFENEMTVDQRKSYLSKQYESLKDAVFPVLDKLFKQHGFGEQLFTGYCHENIETLVKIINILSCVQTDTELKRFANETQQIIKRGDK